MGSIARTEKRLEWQAGGLRLVIDVDSDNHPRLRSIGSAGNKIIETSGGQDPALPLAEVRIAGEGTAIAISKRQMGAALSCRLQYVQYQQHKKDGVEALDVEMNDPQTGLTITSHYAVYGDVPVIRSYVEVRNDSATNRTLQTACSLALGGLTQPSEEWWKEYKVCYAKNSWFREAQ